MGFYRGAGGAAQPRGCTGTRVHGHAAMPRRMNAKYKIQNTKLYEERCLRARGEAAQILFGSAAAVRGPSPSVRFADISPAPRGSLPLPPDGERIGFRDRLGDGAARPTRLGPESPLSLRQRSAALLRRNRAQSAPYNAGSPSFIQHLTSNIQHQKKPRGCAALPCTRAPMHPCTRRRRRPDCEVLFGACGSHFIIGKGEALPSLAPGLWPLAPHSVFVFSLCAPGPVRPRRP